MKDPEDDYDFSADKGRAGIFNGSGKGTLSSPDPYGGAASPAVFQEEKRTTITCDEPLCEGFYVRVFPGMPKGWAEVDGRDYCPKHSENHQTASELKAMAQADDMGFVAEGTERLNPAPFINLEAELRSAEQAAGFGDRDGFVGHESPSAPPKISRPPRLPTINGWWFGLFVVLVLIITGLVLYADALRHQIASYEFQLSLENESSFEHNAGIQRLECTGYETRRCSGLIEGPDQSKRPTAYSCNSTHCAFECGNK